MQQISCENQANTTANLNELKEDLQKLFFTKNSIDMYKKNTKVEEEGFTEILLTSTEICVNGDSTGRQKDGKNKTETGSLPDGGWGWVIVAASFLINLVADGIPYSFGMLLQPLVSAFKSSAGLISFVGSINVAMMYLSAPVTSSLTTKLGTR